jgi:hypothetical protein
MTSLWKIMGGTPMPQATDAFDLALLLLRAHAAGGRGQGVVRPQDLRGCRKIAGGQFGEEFRYANRDGAAGHAGPVLALEAAFGLLDSGKLAEAQVHFLEVGSPGRGILLVHLRTRYRQPLLWR